MTFKQLLDERRSSAISIFHKFRTSTNPDGCVHVFLEGYDDSVFYGRLMHDLARTNAVIWKVHITLGKRNMDRVIQMFYAAQSEKRKVLFIRDSDFDRFLGLAPVGDDVFLTCGYSVENYVCGRTALTAFMTSVFGIDDDEVNINAELDRHYTLVGHIFEWLSPFFGAVFEAILSGQMLELDNLDVKTVYKDLIEGKALPSEIPTDQIKMCNLDEAHFHAASETRGRAYTAQEVSWWLRGKYLMAMTCEFLKYQEIALREKYRRREISRFNRRLSPDFSPGAVFERLSGFSSATDQLLNALSKEIPQ